MAFWLDSLALILASMLALRFSKRLKAFTWGDLAEDLISGGVASLISYGFVGWLSSFPKNSWDSPIVLVIVVIAFIILNSQTVRRMVGR
jgi:hypothetical protein